MTWKECIKEIIEKEWNIDEMFTLENVYKFEYEIAKLYPDNDNVLDKIRQTLQYLRDDEVIRFIDNNGSYQRLK